MAPLTKSYVQSIFSHLTAGDSASFFAHVAPDVDWTVTGSSHPLAGRYTSKAEFIEKSWSRVGGILTEPMRLSVVQVLVDGQWAVIELAGEGGILTNGKEKLFSYA